MAVKFACDCCSKPIEKPNYRGTIKLSHYCDSCVTEIDEVLRERDRIHTETAALFKDRWETVKEEYRAKHPDAKLPDE